MNQGTDAACEVILSDLAFVVNAHEHAVRSLLARLATMPPSAVVIDALMAIDRSRLDAETAVTFLQVLQRVTARLYALEAEALVAAATTHTVVAELQVLDPHPENERMRTIRIEDACREEIACALRQSAQATQSSIDTARLLAGPLPVTKDALRRGEITRGHVAVIVEAARRLPGAAVALSGPATSERRAHELEQHQLFAQACQALETRVVPVAERSTISATRRAARRAVLAIDAAGQERRREAAKGTRDVFVTDEDDGHSLLIARMTTEHAYACMTAIRALAASADLDVPASATAGERRCAAAVALITGDGTQRPHVHAQVDLVIDLETLLGLQATSPGESGVAELRGAGPVSAEAVLALLADEGTTMTLRRLVTDPLTNHLIDVGRTTYAVPKRLREFVVARDRLCRFPGCNRNAARSQIDHAVAWDDGGPTTRANLGAVCVRHHQLKTFGGWDIVESSHDGSCQWRSPQGRRYDHDPPPY